MSENTPTPPLKDPAPKTKVSEKVWFSTLMTVLVTAGLSVGTYVLANEDVLGINNPLLGTLVITLITGLVDFLSGWLKRDPIREAGARRALV